MIEENKKEYAHDEPPILHENPLLSRFWFVQNEGKKRSWSTVESKVLSLDGEVKTKKALTDVSERYQEFLGEEASTTAAASGVKAENPGKKQLETDVETLRSQLTPKENHKK